MAKNKNKKKSKSINSSIPFVSICTPTYNRRPFIPAMIKCFEHQTYSKDKMEWIIIDDGTDKIEDMVVQIPQVKYFKYDEKMVLGKKRNLMHEKAKGDIIIYMDDDDYYPPTRVAHAVEMLISHPRALCAGTSEIYIYFKHINQMIQFGPYGPNHATAGTFAFKKELLKDHTYNDKAALAEEKSFLKDYTVPFVQLEPKKTILVFSHEHNTFDKKTLLENRHPQFVKDSDKIVDDFIKEPDLKEFYMNQIENLLKNYDVGKPEMKPDVLKQIEEIKVERAEMIQKMQQQHMEQQQQQQHIQRQQQQQQQQLQQQQQQQQQQIQQIQHNGQKIVFSSHLEILQYIIQQNQQIISQNQQLIQEQLEGSNVNKIIGEINGEKTILNNEQVVQILQQQKEVIQKLGTEIENKNKIIEKLQKD